jgi:DNA repair protein RadC
MRKEYRMSGLPPEAHKRLEMLLFYILPQVDTNKIAHRLINRFGSLGGVLDAETCELTEIEGVGKSVSEFLCFIGDISRVRDEKPSAKPGIPLDTAELMEAFVLERLTGQKSECILIAYLDAKQRLIHERLARDTVESAARVENSLRVTVSLALRYNAASVLVGHNHPNGCALPSPKDVSEARRLRDSLRNIGIGLSDFIIAGGDGETYSLKGSGVFY